MSRTSCRGSAPRACAAARHPARPPRRTSRSRGGSSEWNRPHRCEAASPTAGAAQQAPASRSSGCFDSRRARRRSPPKDMPSKCPAFERVFTRPRGFRAGPHPTVMLTTADRLPRRFPRRRSSRAQLVEPSAGPSPAAGWLGRTGAAARRVGRSCALCPSLADLTAFGPSYAARPPARGAAERCLILSLFGQKPLPSNAMRHYEGHGSCDPPLRRICLGRTGMFDTTLADLPFDDLSARRKCNVTACPAATGSQS